MLWLGMDKLNSLRVQSTTIGLVENQFQLKEWKLSRKGKFIRINDDWGHSQTYWVNRLKMIMTRNVIKTTRLMGLTIMQASKNFKSQRLQRIFGRSNIILKTFVKHKNNWGWADTRKVRETILRGIQVAKNWKAVTQTVLGTIERISRYLVMTRSTGNKSKNDRCMYLSIGIFRW